MTCKLYLNKAVIKEIFPPKVYPSFIFLFLIYLNEHAASLEKILPLNLESRNVAMEQ